MKELSLNILDIAQNSLTAGAKNVSISIACDTIRDSLVITITDDGCGMSEDFVKKLLDPFTTTRKTRKVGLGLPLLAEGARACEGDVEIISELGCGTTVTATYRLTHIDRMPLGDVAGTFCTLLLASPDLHYTLCYRVDGVGFDLDTDEVRSILGGDVSLATPDVLTFISEYIKENINTTNGGREI